MRWIDVVYLIPISKGKNINKDTVEIEGNPREVFANQKSVKMSEFYQAMAVGLRPELVFEVKKADYNKEKRLIFENVKYNIIRTYSKNTEVIELVCQGMVNS